MSKGEHILWAIIAALMSMLAISNAWIAYISEESFLCFCFGGWYVASIAVMLVMLKLTKIKTIKK